MARICSNICAMVSAFNNTIRDLNNTNIKIHQILSFDNDHIKYLKMTCFLNRKYSAGLWPA